MNADQRPLSPFMIYRWQITNLLSFLHRATGVVLSAGLLILVCWLVALAAGPESFAAIRSFYSGLLFDLVLTGWAFCFFYHLANGIRHLFWDVGWGFGHGQITAGGWAVVVFAVVATLVFALGAVF
jgi:succinate dehydrogenase / fumarate reductase cytochrome b subunit